MQNNNYYKAIKKYKALMLSATAVYLVLIEPSFADDIDLSPITKLFHGINTQLDGSTGKEAATAAVIAALLAWFFGYVNWMTLIFIFVAIVGIGSAPTIVSSLWIG